jgi:hypothetical protein
MFIWIWGLICFLCIIGVPAGIGDWYDRKRSIYRCPEY